MQRQLIGKIIARFEEKGETMIPHMGGQEATSSEAAQCQFRHRSPIHASPSSFYNATRRAQIPCAQRSVWLVSSLRLFLCRLRDFCLLFSFLGFTLVAMKMLTPSKSQAEGHYEDLATKPFFKSLTSFFSSGPIVASQHSTTHSTSPSSLLAWRLPPPSLPLDRVTTSSSLVATVVKAPLKTTKIFAN